MAYDAIVIGAGHNGLAAAATLAAKGAKVCVIEKSTTLGGMAQTSTIGDSIPVSRIAHLIYNMSPDVVSELGLSESVQLKALRTISLSPQGEHAVLCDGQATLIDGAAHPEAEAYAELHADLKQFAALLAPLMAASPPGSSADNSKLDQVTELLSAAKLGLKLKRFGKVKMREFLRIVLSNVYDYTLNDLSDGPIAGALAADAVKGSFSGPRSPGTVLSLMYRMGAGIEPSLPIGGMGIIAEGMAKTAEAAGTEIRRGVGVTRVLVEDDRAIGVQLEDGTELRAKTVLSSLGALQSMRFAGVEHYDTEAVRRLRNVRNKGTAAKVNLVLSELPVFTDLSREQLGSRLLIAPSSSYVERAFNPVKYGDMSPSPVLEIVLPCLHDPAQSDNKQQLLSIVVHYVPYELNGGWDDAAHARLLDITLATLDQYAPGLSALVIASDVLSPIDIETLTGAPGGHWHHGEWCVDQLFTVRPVNGLAHYRFDIEGYYLCGAAAHPGGDVTGLAGRNAALQLIKDGVLL